MYLVRVNANSKTSGAITVSNMKIYNENEQHVEMDTIDDKTMMITIVEVQGVKCSSKSFQIDIEIKQIMVLKPVDLFQKCIIKSSNPMTSVLPEPLEENARSTTTTTTTTVLKPVEELPPIKIEINEKPIETKVEEEIKMKVVEDDHDDVDDDDDDDYKQPTIKILSDDVSEVDLDLDNLEESDTFHLKEKTEVYYEMYREARRKAKLAKSLALSSFMEARRIKNLYMLDDIDDSDSDLDDLEESM